MNLILLSAICLSVSSLWADRPNFVFILGDDINRDNLGCYGGGVECRTLTEALRLLDGDTTEANLRKSKKAVEPTAS